MKKLIILLLLCFPFVSFGAASITFKQADKLDTDLTEYTFANVSFGSAASDRFIIVQVAARGVGTTRTLNSATIGGVSATISVQLSNTSGGNTTVSAIIIAAVPNGTTGDVVLTFDTTMLRAGMGAYETNSVNISANDSDSSPDNDPSGSINVSAGGIALGGGFNARFAPSAVHSGLTERYDDDLETFTHTGASDAFASTQSPLSVSINFTTDTGSVQATTWASYDEFIAGAEQTTNSQVIFIGI